MGDFWLLLVLVSPVMGALTLRKECRYDNTPPKETQAQSRHLSNWEKPGVGSAWALYEDDNNLKGII